MYSNKEMEMASQGAAGVCYTVNLGQNVEGGIYLKNLCVGGGGRDLNFCESMVPQQAFHL